MLSADGGQLPGECYIHAMSAEWEEQEKYPLFQLGVFTRYSTVVSLSANLVATPDKQPKLAAFVLLCIFSSLLPSETRYKHSAYLL